MGRDFPDQDDPVRFLPFYLEAAARIGSFHELEVIGWSDETLRRTILGSTVRKLGGAIVQCQPNWSDLEFRRALAAACTEAWSGSSSDVYRRIRDAFLDRVRIALLEDAHHLAPRFIRSLQSLLHDTPAFAVLSSGSAALFEKVWRAARGHPLLAYCGFRPYGVPLPKPLLDYLRRFPKSLLEKDTHPSLRLHRPS